MDDCTQEAMLICIHMHNMYACTKYIDLEIELDLEIIKKNILSKIHDDCFKNVTARVLTRFSADLAR